MTTARQILYRRLEPRRRPEGSFNVTMIVGTRGRWLRQTIDKMRSVFVGAHCILGNPLQVTMADVAGQCRQWRADIGMTEYAGSCSVCYTFICSACCQQVNRSPMVVYFRPDLELFGEPMDAAV